MRNFKSRFIPCMIAVLLIFQLSFCITNRETRFKTIHKDRCIYNSANPELLGILSTPSTLLSNNEVGSAVSSLCTANSSVSNITNELPDTFRYKDINKDALKAYLSFKSSILKEEPYFSSIIKVAKSFNINPLLLFAITGQEQGFVPQGDVSAATIANNPYNVFYSWQSYNTNIIDSSEIACRTIINLSKNRPISVDPLVWINQKYSSDQNWHCGVRNLYNEITRFISEYEKKT